MNVKNDIIVFFGVTMKFKSLLLKQSLIKKKQIKMKSEIHAHQKTI